MLGGREVPTEHIPFADTVGDHLYSESIDPICLLLPAVFQLALSMRRPCRGASPTLCDPYTPGQLRDGMPFVSPDRRNWPCGSSPSRRARTSCQRHLGRGSNAVQIPESPLLAWAGDEPGRHFPLLANIYILPLFEILSHQTWKRTYPPPAWALRITRALQASRENGGLEPRWRVGPVGLAK